MLKGSSKYSLAAILHCLLPLALATFLISACTDIASPAATSTNYDPDLFAWTTASWMPFTTSDSISGMAFGLIDGQTRYAAVTRSGLIAWSDDGDIWNIAQKHESTLLDPFSGGTVFKSVAFGDGGAVKFVAVGDSGRAAYSYDAIKWYSYTTDGTTHNKMAGFASGNINGIAYGGTYFIAVGENGNAAHSGDGITWEDIHIIDTLFANTTINAICFGDGKFYIAANDGWIGYTADNGSTWHVTNHGGTAPFWGSNPDNNLISICYGGPTEDGKVKIGVLCYSGRGMAVTDDFEGSMSNGSLWDPDLDKTGWDLSNKPLRGIAWGDHYYVAGGVDAHIGWWPDTDRLNDRFWRYLSYRQFRGREITGIYALNGRFFVSSIGGKIAYSK
ncbi:MAG: hypothetical protein Ta2B_20990 [Termitinemataceae bacterium]|nr:MAG: hypothetical protein Ta2B_20990 [Termitinemataceae bacterium]